VSSKINIIGILRDHFSTLADQRSGATSRIDMLVFFIVPTIVGIGAGVLGLDFTDGVIGLLINAYSIFAGLLINVLVLLFTISSMKTSDDKAEDKAERVLLFEMFSNVSYLIFVSITCTVSLILAGFVDKEKIISSIVLALSINFILTLLMCVKRLHELLKIRFPVL
jgi:hypothetical protein